MRLFNSVILGIASIRLGTHYGLPLADSQTTLTYLSLLSNYYIQRYLNIRDARA